MILKVNEIENWLRETDTNKLKQLWQLADDIRAQNVGGAVHLRGLLEISNYCARECAYCGINVANNKVERYRMSADEIISAAQKTEKLGYGTVVIQAGEDYGIQAEWMANIIKTIKNKTSLAITLSLGERTTEELKLWRMAGANRYLLRFETSNQKLYAAIHPPNKNQPQKDRIAILKQLRTLGYEIGSGVMIGIPGQSYHDLAKDIKLFADLDLDMIGCGPYISHPDTALGKNSTEGRTLTSEHVKKNFTTTMRVSPKSSQAPNSELMTYKVIALARIVCPQANIPTTTALATLNKGFGRENGLQRGANVVMPNVTEPKYRVKYQLYPNKACLNETAEECNGCLTFRLSSIKRSIGKGHGNRRIKK